MKRDGALLGALLLGALLVVLGPSLGQATTHLIGIEGDNGAHLWGQWWVFTQLVEHRVLPLQTQHIWYPDGGGFFSMDTGTALLMAPVRPFLSEIVTFNAHVVVQLLLAGVAGAALARRVGVAGPAAAVAGVAFAFNAWVLAFPVGAGVSEALFLWPFPVVAIGALDALERPGWRGPALLVVGLLAHAVGSPIFAIMSGLGCLGIGAVWLLGRPWRRPGALQGGLLRVALSAALLLLVVAPLLVAVVGTTEGVEPIYPRESGAFSTLDPLQVPEASVLAIADWFLPGAAGLQVAEADFDRLMFSGYLGYGLLGLVALGVWRGGRAGRWAAAAAVPWLVLGLGARLHLGHDMSGAGLPNPLFLGLFHGMPYFHTTLHSVDRFVAPGMLCLGLSAAAALRATLGGRGWAAQAGATTLAVALIVAELVLVSPPPWPVPTRDATAHPASAWLAADQQPGAVIDLPLRSEGFFVGDIVVQQITHGRPVPIRLTGRNGEIVHPAVWDTALFQRAYAPFEPEARRRPTGCEGTAELAEAGFAFFVVRRDRLDAATAAAVEAPLRDCLGAPVVVDTAAIFRIDPAAAEDPRLRNPRGWRAPPRHGVGGPGHGAPPGIAPGASAPPGTRPGAAPSAPAPPR
jgi:hypothetical protein